MWQNIIVILIVTAATVWLLKLAYGWIFPGTKRSGCAGGCGCGGENNKPASSQTSTNKNQILPTEDLIARLNARNTHKK